MFLTQKYMQWNIYKSASAESVHIAPAIWAQSLQGSTDKKVLSYTALAGFKNDRNKAVKPYAIPVKFTN